MLFYATLSALFHLHAMRRGAFLTGREGRSIRNDFRRVPQLILGSIVAPIALLSAGMGRLMRVKGAEAAY